jgi:hypothetical protein
MPPVEEMIQSTWSERKKAMYAVLQVLTVMLVALAAALSVAHALELPGKMRLDEGTYRAVQRIYYPGFTFGGIAEFPSIIAIAVLLFLTPAASASFWLVLIALPGMTAMHAIYWFVVHPVNRYWMEGHQVSAAAASFFGSKRDQR